VWAKRHTRGFAREWAKRRTPASTVAVWATSQMQVPRELASPMGPMSRSWEAAARVAPGWDTTTEARLRTAAAAGCPAGRTPGRVAWEKNRRGSAKAADRTAAAGTAGAAGRKDSPRVAADRTGSAAGRRESAAAADRTGSAAAAGRKPEAEVGRLAGTRKRVCPAAAWARTHRGSDSAAAVHSGPAGRTVPIQIRAAGSSDTPPRGRLRTA
jgi:hypothetical protein